jgi:hypothetical protein
MSQQQNCKSTIERAFEIAASGEVMTIEQLSARLGREGYQTNMLSGPVLLKQLRQRIAERQPAAAAETQPAAERG